MRFFNWKSDETGAGEDAAKRVESRRRRNARGSESGEGGGHGVGDATLF